MSGLVFQNIASFQDIVSDALLKPRGITISQGWAAMTLIRENCLRQADLAERLNIRTVTTSKLLDRLEARGFIGRRANLGDRRWRRIFARAKASQSQGRMTPTQRQVDAVVNAGADLEDLDVTMRVLGQIRQNLKTSITSN